MTGATNARPVGRWPLGTSYLLAAVFLSVFAGLLAGGFGRPHTSAQGAVAALAVLVMTAPVAVARSYPVAVAAALAVGAVANAVAVGPAVRCGGALPAALLAAYALGRWTTGRYPPIAGAALIAVDVVAQSLSDPQLEPSVPTYVVPIAVAFLGLGRLVRGRARAVRDLEQLTEELREQRERNTMLAVARDRDRIADELDTYLREQLDQIAETAGSGRALLEWDRVGAEAAFVTIQETGRATLGRMRAVVTDLGQDPATDPPLVLAELRGLLAQLDRPDASLVVRGDPRRLAPGLELSAYRIVEHLLGTVSSDPGSTVEVSVTFTDDALELAVAGAVSPRASSRVAAAAAGERAALHSGTIRLRRVLGRCESVAVLPLATAHV
jgi:signal transduction histidine kinase